MCNITIGKKIKDQVTAPRHYCTKAFCTDPVITMKLPTYPPSVPQEQRGRDSTDRLFTFLCLPLNTTAKAPCPTRSFLLYSKSPTGSMVAGLGGSGRSGPLLGRLNVLGSSENNPGANDALDQVDAAGLISCAFSRE